MNSLRAVLEFSARTPGTDGQTNGQTGCNAYCNLLVDRLYNKLTTMVSDQIYVTFSATRSLRATPINCFCHSARTTIDPFGSLQT